MRGELRKWDGKACGQLAINVGLPQYAESFAFNLTGAALPSLQMTQLAQLGVTAHTDQKTVMKAVRDLLHAYERRAAVAKAQASWTLTLATLRAMQDPTLEQDASQDVAPVAEKPPKGRSPRRGGERGGRRRLSRRPERPAEEAPLRVVPPTPSLPSQRPDPSKAGSLSEVGSHLGAPPTRLPFLAGAKPSPRDAAESLISALPTLSPRGRGSGFETGATLQAAADAVGQPTSERDGLGALPVNSWLISPRGVAPIKRSPRSHARLPAAFPAPSGDPQEAAARRIKPLTRNQELSRRILASLATGGKMEPGGGGGDFRVAAKNEYARARAEEVIIRRRLGLGDA